MDGIVQRSPRFLFGWEGILAIHGVSQSEQNLLGLRPRKATAFHPISISSSHQTALPCSNIKAWKLHWDLYARENFYFSTSTSSLKRTLDFRFWLPHRVIIPLISGPIQSLNFTVFFHWVFRHLFLRGTRSVNLLEILQADYPELDLLDRGRTVKNIPPIWVCLISH